jgi:hypothetical protein
MELTSPTMFVHKIFDSFKTNYVEQSTTKLGNAWDGVCLGQKRLKLFCIDTDVGHG